MKNNIQKNVLPIIDRYEAKFTIPFDMVAPISDFVSIYCYLDKYSEAVNNQFYKVNNLYFDSPNYLFLRNRLDGCDNRFNMRMRSYGDSSTMPYFFEIKQKHCNVIRKYRAKVSNAKWFEMFERSGCEQDFKKDDMGISNLNLFLRLAIAYNAAPKVLTQYTRKAYISDVDDYARVTFDIDLRYQPENNYNLVPDENQMIHLDHPLRFDPDCNVILELKCYPSQVPFWMIDLIKQFNLQRRSFSKYVTGVTEVLQLFHYATDERQSILV